MVKTKTLLLLSLGCAFAILAAGAGLFLRLDGGQATDVPVAIGEEVEVGDVFVTVNGIEQRGTTAAVLVSVRGIAAVDISNSFAVIAAGASLELVPKVCAVDATTTTTCDVEFLLPSSTDAPYVFLATRGEERVRWVLGAGETALP